MDKKAKQLVKIVAVHIEQPTVSSKRATTTARGIAALKRGTTLEKFMVEFMTERVEPPFSLHQRSEKDWASSPMMALNQTPARVITFHFTQFSEDELPFQAKDLTKEELERDMKQLKGWITWQK